MKKIIALTFTLLLMTAVVLAQAAQPAQGGEMAKKKDSKPAKAAPAPKSDEDVLKCITDKLAASKTITGGGATVANGEATLTGAAKSGGAKGGATRSAKACGAKTVTNNMTVVEAAKGEAKAVKKAEPTKKP